MTPTVTLYQGDCLEVMRGMDADSIDSIVTDPPYGLSFMGKDWDHGIPGVHHWREALRVAKPGAHMLAFGGTRTFHRLTCAIEDAGWEIRDTVMWVYGSGFPKSLDVSKAIDKAAGAEREVVGQYASFRPNEHADTKYNGNLHTNGAITAPATDAALQWQGWGTALKPAWEPIIVARKPLQGTVAANVLAWGTGAINVDGCRVGTLVDGHRTNGKANDIYGDLSYTAGQRWEGSPIGRWPANFIHDGSEEVVGLMPDVKAGVAVRHNSGGNTFGDNNSKPPMADMGYDDSGSAARFFKACPFTEEDNEWLPSDASRFLYQPKASKADRDEGLERWRPQAGATWGAGIGHASGEDVQRRNNHPTVKPTALMRYLCRLVTPPGGTVLDPFMGSGSTGKAAVLEGFGFVGIELEPEYLEIAEARIGYARQQLTLQLEPAL